jgi:hypothetical protein
MSAVRAVPVTEEGLRYVVTHMRDRDRAEIYALRWDDDPETVIHELTSVCGAMCWVWEWDGVPVSIQGVVPQRPGVWSMFAFGTDQWRRVIRDMTRHAERFIKPALRRALARRVECRALASHTDSRRWIEHLGAHLEYVLPHYGRADETFVSYVWFPMDADRCA